MPSSCVHWPEASWLSTLTWRACCWVMGAGVHYHAQGLGARVLDEMHALAALPLGTSTHRAL